ncbi:uncharacterized protein C8A04DRAFT_30673 [Dichotomopilus funicola]|uniref:Zn(2)-C6 fungal-type domain-containing protein n=1 Tax=Dichotomopilus funicola TaxID=1934379 RepID=A0AAN6UYT4_9PEZI|nr:hypothetical protein C8A04DRAFT_30673 [Dichotomopilus funicola]
MGKQRSRDGCLTCRSRHVKCDETRPICGNCRKSNRDCRLVERRAEIRFHNAPSTRASRSKTPGSNRALSTSSTSSPPFTNPPYTSPPISIPQLVFADFASPDYPPSLGPVDPTPTSPVSVSPHTTRSPPEIPNIPTQHSSQHSQHTTSTPTITPTPPITPNPTLTRAEASLLHHYTTHLARWLDCTDATRHFTLQIPALATTRPVLLDAILSFAARHRGDVDAADAAHERCITRIIVLLDEQTNSSNTNDNNNEGGDDESSPVGNEENEKEKENAILLCAIVILRVFEQLTAGSQHADRERHLAGCGALLQQRQICHAAPSGLHEAAFWVYMRQCLYNACIHQQALPANVEGFFEGALLPPVDDDGTPAGAASRGMMGEEGRLRGETAWANSMTWICARVVQFCFGGDDAGGSIQSRMARWVELEEAVEGWMRLKPGGFEPVWQGESPEGDTEEEDGVPWPEYCFAADWHVVAFGFYQLARILLVLYKPSPRFVVRRVGGGLRREDALILQHARALCGSCKSEPGNVPARITLCHSLFLWGGLLDDPRERAGVVQLLEELERDHAWPTAWIISLLREEWGTTDVN